MINTKNLVLGLGIIVVFALALWQGIETFYASPQYEDFCDISFREPIPIPTESEKPNLLVNEEFERCQAEYDSARDAHAQFTFIVSLIVAIITILVGYSLLSTEPVGSALLGSGIWAIFWGSAINWRNFSDIWRFLLLLTALVLLIILALRLNRKKKKGFLQRILKN